MGDLPFLDPDAAVRFASREALALAWDSTLGRGVLIVRPGKPLSPLQQFDIAVSAPDVAPLTVAVEVVHLEAQRAMLRFVRGPLRAHRR